MLKSWLKTSMLDCASNSGIHGLPNIARTNIIPLKLTWTVLLLASFASCGYLMALSILEYFEYNVTTTARVFLENSIEFPAIKICQSSPFTSDRGVKFLQDTEPKVMYTETFENDFLNYEFMFKKTSIIDQLAAQARGSNITDEMRSSFGFSLEEFVLSCTFLSMPCQPSDWLQVYDSYAGNCFVFNSGLNRSIKQTNLPGEWSGLRVYLYLNDKGYYYFNQAVQIFVYDQHSKKVKSAKASALPGHESVVIAKKTVTIQEPHPYSNCTLDIESFSPETKEISDILREINYDYNRDDCIYLCFKKKVLEKCSCNIVYEPVIKAAPICLNSTQVDCFNNAFLKFYNKSDELAHCERSYCPTRCDQIRYDLVVMTSNLCNYDLDQINEKYEKRWNSTLTKNNLVALNVYFEQLSYTEIREQPTVTLLLLISNVGGLLGLFGGLR